MLSRVAERLYWTGRYLERAEDTARIINVHTNLLLDLPKGTTIGWEPLIAIFGHDITAFSERHGGATESSVVNFMLLNRENPGSIFSSLHHARENLRTTRDIVPRESWEKLNAMYQNAREQSELGTARRARYAFLTQVIEGCQHIAGLLAGTMSHDHVYDFIRIGRNIERADMTSRIIDVRSANLLINLTEDLTPFATIQWMSVLKSLTAYQMYRRHVHVRVRGAEVLRFLLQDAHFPRSIHHCLGEVQQSLHNLPRNEVPRRQVTKLRRQIHEANVEVLSQAGLHGFIDDLQLALARLHERIRATYFLAETPLPGSNSIAA